MAKKARVYQWRDPSRLGRAAILALSIGGLLLAARAMVAVLYGPAAVYSAASALSGPQGLAWTVDMLMLPVAIAEISVVMWIWRANANGHVFKRNMRFSPRGAIGFYLVPFVSLFLPFAAMEEIWLVSEGRGASKTPALLRWWWGFLIVDGLLNIASVMGMRMGEAAPPAFATANAVTGIVTTLLLIQIIQRVTQMQCERFASGPQGEAPPSGGGVLADLASG